MSIPGPSQTALDTPSRFQWPVSDEIFHLAPLLPVYSSLTGIHVPDQAQHTSNALNQDPNCPGTRDIPRPLDGSESADDPGDSDPHRHNINEFNVHHHVVPHPLSAREAYLLLEAARADRRIVLARESLAHQIIHRNTLVLQYNRMALERAQNDLCAANRFVGQVRFLIRKSGQSAAFEYAMQEDYLVPYTSECPNNHSPLDVDLT